jgi:succinate-semialdehyde dehydrogenase/glutarate-semialdehyde dehydrogenase
LIFAVPATTWPYARDAGRLQGRLAFCLGGEIVTTYSDVLLFIDGEWRKAADGASLPVVNPATGETLATVAKAGIADLDAALEAADKGFRKWRSTSAYDRMKLMRKAAEIVRERADDIAWTITSEQGKTLAEAKIEANFGGEIIDWFAEEGRRTYGRVIPARFSNVAQLAIKEPVGVVAGFSPWNFPINQAVRKISAALGAGCSIILKGPEETPGACAALVRAFADAGVPAGVVNLVFGVPAEISTYLIPHPIVRKVTFTGSTAVGKQLAALAGAHMKRVTISDRPQGHLHRLDGGRQATRRASRRPYEARHHGARRPRPGAHLRGRRYRACLENFVG